MIFKQLHNIKKQNNLWCNESTIIYFCVIEFGIVDKYNLLKRVDLFLDKKYTFSELCEKLEFVLDIMLSDKDYTK